jgi:hypothetical protein
MPALGGGGTQAGGGGGGGGGAEYLSCVFESPRARPLRLAAFQDWLASGWGRYRLLRVKGFVSFFEEGAAAEPAAAARSRPVRFLFHGSGRQRFELRPEAEGGDGGGGGEGVGILTVAAGDLAVQLVLIGESHGLDGAAAALEAACGPPRSTVNTAALGGAEMDVLVRD